MKKIVRCGLLILLSLLLCSCRTDGQVYSDFGETAYVPAEEWIGLETTDYAGKNGDDLSLGEEGYVAAYPHGSPSPDIHEKAPPNMTGYPMDLFTVSTDKTQYSISELEIIEVYVRLQGDPASEAYTCVNRIVNLERLDGGEWVRMISYPSVKFLAISNWTYIRPHAESRLQLDLACVATKLYPGKYRVVAYVNDDCAPLYAELELIE